MQADQQRVENLILAQAAPQHVFFVRDEHRLGAEVRRPSRAFEHIEVVDRYGQPGAFGDGPVAAVSLRQLEHGGQTVSQPRPIICRTAVWLVATS